MGVFRLAVDTPVTLKLAGFESGYPDGSFLWIVNHIYFQYYSLLITLVSIVTMFVVSYLSEPPSESQLIGLTYETVTSDHAGQGLTEHTTAFDALVLVIDGSLTITIGATPVRAAEGTVMRLPANVPHAVDAPESARMLLIMLRNPKQA